MYSGNEKSANLKQISIVLGGPCALEADFRRLVWRRGEGPPTKRRSWAIVEERCEGTTHCKATAWVDKRSRERYQSDTAQLLDRNEDVAMKMPRVRKELLNEWGLFRSVWREIKSTVRCST